MKNLPIAVVRVDREARHGMAVRLPCGDLELRPGFKRAARYVSLDKLNMRWVNQVEGVEFGPAIRARRCAPRPYSMVEVGGPVDTLFVGFRREVWICPSRVLADVPDPNNRKRRLVVGACRLLQASVDPSTYALTHSRLRLRHAARRGASQRGGRRGTCVATDRRGVDSRAAV